MPFHHRHAIAISSDYSVGRHGCGLAAWRPNSATASAPDGPFTLQRLIKPHFADEPVAVISPADGTILIYHSNADPHVRLAPTLYEPTHLAHRVFLSDPPCFPLPLPAP